MSENAKTDKERFEECRAELLKLLDMIVGAVEGTVQTSAGNIFSMRIVGADISIELDDIFISADFEGKTELADEFQTIVDTHDLTRLETLVQLQTWANEKKIPLIVMIENWDIDGSVLCFDDTYFSVSLDFRGKEEQFAQFCEFIQIYDDSDFLVLYGFKKWAKARNIPCVVKFKRWNPKSWFLKFGLRLIEWTEERVPGYTVPYSKR